MMVDDAHASGVFGRQGRGTVDHFGCHGRVDIQVGTLSKAIGVLGGYVAGTQGLHRVPVSPRAAVPVLDLASAGGGGGVHRRDRRARDTSRSGWSSCGTTRASSRPACRRSASTPGAARARSRRSSSARRRRPWRCRTGSFEAGVFAQGIGFPTVARGKARLRTIVTATHTRDDLQFALDAFGKVGQGTGGHLITSVQSAKFKVSVNRPSFEL